VKRERERVGERRLGGDVAELDAERHDRLRDLRPDAGDRALGPEQAGGADGLEQVLRDLGVHGRHAGDVDHRVVGARRHERVEELLHDQLSARRVERADERHRDDPLPQPYDRRGELKHRGRLVGDDLLARRRVRLEGPQAQVVDHTGEGEELGHQIGGVRHEFVHGLLQCEQPERGLAGREAVPGAAPRKLVKGSPELAGGVIVGTGQHPDDQRVKAVKLAPHFIDRGPAAHAGDDQFAPAAHDLVVVVAQVFRHALPSTTNVHRCVFLNISDW
jgi:hypothetical protein